MTGGVFSLLANLRMEHAIASSDASGGPWSALVTTKICVGLLPRLFLALRLL